MNAPLRQVPLSVLDLSPISAGSTAADALASTIDLARHVEALGFTRFWLAEHHSMPGIASSSPALVIGAVAAATMTIRVGSGGIMLPNHPPLVVAEQFGTLGALYPGRIDLGIGRAPGTDPVTARALRRSVDALSADDFPEQLMDLMRFFAGEFPDGHPFGAIRAVPRLGDGPPVWLLGSSGYSAQVAGMLGLPFAFAHHFSSANTVPAIELYRRSFVPSSILERPYAMVAAQVVVADTDERARWLARSSALSFLWLRQGRPAELPSPEEAAAYPWTAEEIAFVNDREREQAIGSADTVSAALARLLDITGADELMATAALHDPRERIASFTKLREIFDIDLPQGHAGAGGLGAVIRG